MKKKIILAISTCAVIGASAGVSYASDTADCTSIDRSTIETVLEKQRAGTTLTDAETTLLESAKTCLEKTPRSGSGRLDRSGSGGLDRGRGSRFGSGMTMSGAQMPNGVDLTDAEKESLKTMTDAEKKAFFESKRAAMGSGTTKERQHNGEQEGTKSAYRAKISSSYATTVDTLMNKYMSSIASKTTDERVAAIDVMLAKITKVESSVQSSSSYSDNVKSKYANIFGYLRQSFEEQKSSLSSSEDDTSVIDSLLQ